MLYLRDTSLPLPFPLSLPLHLSLPLPRPPSPTPPFCFEVVAFKVLADEKFYTEHLSKLLKGVRIREVNR